MTYPEITFYKERAMRINSFPLLTTMTAFTFCLAHASGCSQPDPTGAGGVVSVVQQKCLTMAAERAMEQAELNEARLAQHRVYMRHDSSGTTDPGADRVCEAVKARIRKGAAGVAEDSNSADDSVTYRVRLAGVDVSQSSFLGFWSATTTAEVKLGFTYQQAGNKSEERDGTGTARHKQSKWLGIPLGESWK